MQHIQDNEFDQSFRDRFEEAEIEAPAHLWNKIETQLAIKPRRVFPVYWLAAAIGVVALSAGLFYFHPIASGVNERERSARLSASTAVSKKEQLSKDGGAAIPLSTFTAKSKPVSPALLKESGKEAEDSKKDLADLQPLVLNTHLYAKEITVKQEKLSLPSSGDVVLANNAEGSAAGDEVINENETRTENRGIRNMGDLINYVVDKVDKSDEKIIQFKTEDDNSSLVALNIGIIRFNTKKHK